VLQDTKEYRDT